MKVDELAKKINVSTPKLIKNLKELGIKVSSGKSDLSNGTVEEIIAIYAEPPSEIIPIEELPNISNKIFLPITVGKLAKMLNIHAGEIVKRLLTEGIIVTINRVVNAEIVNKIARIFHLKIEVVEPPKESMGDVTEDSPETLQPRPPVVTIMGHVDHGKTLLLDAIRESNVVETEIGGITQHIGAYKVTTKRGEVVFLDTPGHEAFTAMRARGAQVTDVVILVVAADDGVMPQTIEALNHAKAAEVPIVVAVNKIDIMGANPQRIRQQLSEYGLVPEEWGGKIIYVDVSAKEKIGIDKLLEMMSLEAEMLELKTNPNCQAKGIVIETRLDKGKGHVATVLIQRGKLRIRNPFVCGLDYGKVRAMFDDRGHRLKEASVSTPVEVVGFNNIPEVGDDFYVVDTEQLSKELSIQAKESVISQRKIPLPMTLEALYKQIQEGTIKELKLIIKGDVWGSVEVLRDTLEKLSASKVKVRVIHQGVGGITESDVMLAAASSAVIIGFHVKPTPEIKKLADSIGVEIRTYSIIFEASLSIKKALEGLLEPIYEEVLLGEIEVREIFPASKIGVITGSYVKTGVVKKGASVKLIRDKKIVFEDKIVSLRRFKEDVSEVKAGFECGVGLGPNRDIQKGDILQVYTLKQVAQQL